MAENSKIEWTHHSFNPWIGCQKVGPGCDHCYAETWDGRGLLGQATRWGAHAARTRTSASNWRKPLAWDRAAAAAGERHRVFCASLADVFDNHPSIDPQWRDDLWHLIARTPNLDWMLLTKRPGNIAGMLPDGRGQAPAWDDGWPNVWLGCTVVNQAEADRDIPKLLAVPARVRFLSMEPLLGPVDLTVLPYGEVIGNAPTYHDALRGKLWMNEGTVTWATDPRATRYGRTYVDLTVGLDLVIVGGESGTGARPMHPDWVRSLRDECLTAGVPFFFKQWGDWAPPEIMTFDRPPQLRLSHRAASDPSLVRVMKGDISMGRIGKKAAGRLLDGQTHSDMPALVGGPNEVEQ